MTTEFSHKKGLLVLASVFGGLVVFGLLRSLPGQQAVIGGIFAFTVALWVTEALPVTVTALLSSAALVVVGGLDEKSVFAAYGDVLVPLFVGSFILAKAMELTGLSERFAWLILRTKWATRSSSALLLALGIVGCTLSLFVSNTATTAMLLPIGISLLRTLKVHERGAHFAIATMLMLTWSSSVAVGVPVGTPPNLIGIGLIQEATGQSIGFVQWMGFAMPITAVMLVSSWLVLRTIYRDSPPTIIGAKDVANEGLERLGAFAPSERNTLIAFFVALGLWIAPDLTGFMANMATGETPLWAKELSSRVTPAVAALVAATLLFVLPATDRSHGRTLSWKEAGSIDWGVIFLFGGGIALGQAMFKSGLAESLGKAAAQATGAHTLWAITALAIAAAIVLSELASNTAAATTLVPVAIGIAEGAGVSPIPPALGAALGASLGFMLPVSTAPNAIVYSSGLVPPREMMRAGLAIDVVGFFATFLCLRVVLPWMGLA